MGESSILGHNEEVYAITMAGAAHTLVIGARAASTAQTEMTGRVGYIDCGGDDLVLTLPAEANCEGFYWFHNASDGQETVTIVNDAGAAVCTIPRQGSALLACDGTTWRHAPFRHFDSQAATSTAITNTTTEAVYDNGTVTFPAGALKVGTVIRYRASGFVVSSNGADTMTCAVRLGGVGGSIVNTTAAVNITDNDTFLLEGLIQIRTIGTGGTLYAEGTRVLGVAGTATATHMRLASTAIDTTAETTLVVTCDYSAASTANQSRLEVFVVELLERG